MKTIYKLLLALVLSSTIISCSKFFEETSQNLAYVTSVDDLDELLVGDAYYYLTDDWTFSGSPFVTSASLTVWGYIYNYRMPFFINLMDDDISEYALGANNMDNKSIQKWAAENNKHLHHWQKEPFTNYEELIQEDVNWSMYYRRIGILNSVLHLVPKMREKGEDPVKCDRVEGEARFLRAYYYMWLINCYALPYDVSTANTQLGVPLKTEPGIEDKYFERNTMKECYDQIRTDIHSAVSLLDKSEKLGTKRGTYTAAALLASRVNLYSGEYKDAIIYAEKAIKRGSHSLLNYNSMNFGESITFLTSPETIFNQGRYFTTITQHGIINVASYYAPEPIPASNGYKASDDLIESFLDGDLRLKLGFSKSIIFPTFDVLFSRKVMNREDGEVADCGTLRLPEAYLNKAEAEAILGKTSEAIATMAELHKTRFSSDNRPTLPTSEEELVNFIRNDRRCELHSEGHRWFDLRRYAVNAEYPKLTKIKHVHYTDKTENGQYKIDGYYELDEYPNDKGAWVLPIPTKVLSFNKGNLKPNEDRKERQLIPTETVE